MVEKNELKFLLMNDDAHPNASLTIFWSDHLLRPSSQFHRDLYIVGLFVG